MRMSIFASILSLFILISPQLAKSGSSGKITFYDKPIVVEGFSFYDKNNKKIGFESFKGKPLMLNIWATWCNSCVAEMPDLMRFNKKYSSDYEFIALSIDRKGFDVLNPFIKKQGWKDIAIYHDRNKLIFSALGLRGTPTTFMLNKSGNIVARIDGVPEWNDEIINKLIDHASL